MKSRLPSSSLVVSPRALRVEPLESRICPSTVVLTPGSNLLHSGDTGTDNVGNVIVHVGGGAALVFVTDNVAANGIYDSGELTGIALGANASLMVNDPIHGDIVTNLDSDGTLSGAGNAGSVLLDSSVSGLTVSGGVNKILIGHDLTNVSVTSASEIRTGTAAGGPSFDFGSGPVALAAFIPADGDMGGAITNLTITAGIDPLTLVLGNGGDSADNKAGEAGKFKDVYITNAADVSLTGGQGGNGFKSGGKGTEFDTFSITAIGAGSDIVIDAGGGGSVMDVDGAKGIGGSAGDILRGTLDAGGSVSVNTTGGDGGTGSKGGGRGSSLEQIAVAAVGDITLMGTDGAGTPNGVFLDGKKGHGGFGGHVTGKLTFAADPIVLQTINGTVTIIGGNGGSGGRSGGSGGAIFGFDINPSPIVPAPSGDVTLIAGNGVGIDFLTGSIKGTGGIGGTINSITISTIGDVSLLSGNGGSGTDFARDGGTISFIQIRHANNVTFVAGAGGGDNSFPTGETQSTDGGGAGGSITNNRVGGLPDTFITGDVTFMAGNGYGTPTSTDLRTGGAGGAIIDAVIVTAGNIVLTAGTGGSADTNTADVNSSHGGSGGLIDPIEMEGMNITVTAGVGGTGITRGGDGGEVSRLTILSSGEVNAITGDGGGSPVAPQPKTGGKGGDMRNVVVTLTGSGFVRAIVAGDGGAGTNDGEGGSIQTVSVTGGGGSIGDFTAAYGIAGMGGLFAGSGNTAGDVLDVVATQIANIVAGHGAIPVTAVKVTGITATTIGTDLNDNGKFDFHDVNGTGLYEPGTADSPIDGFVLAESLGTITGTTLYKVQTQPTLTQTGTPDPQP